MSPLLLWSIPSRSEQPSVGAPDDCPLKAALVPGPGRAGHEGDVRLQGCAVTFCISLSASEFDTSRWASPAKPCQVIQGCRGLESAGGHSRHIVYVEGESARGSPNPAVIGAVENLPAEVRAMWVQAVCSDAIKQQGAGGSPASSSVSGGLPFSSSWEGLLSALDRGLGLC